MAPPIIRESISAATAAGPGDSVDALGHHHTGLFVVATQSPTSLTVQLEVSPDEANWAAATDLSGGTVEITEADLTTDSDGNGNETAHVATPGLYGAKLRANVTAYDAAGEVTAYVMKAGNAGQGRKGYGRKGPVSNL